MNRIKTSEANKQVILSLTNNKYGFKDNRTIGQIAIAYSLQLNKRFTDDEFTELDNRGFEYPQTLLGEINKHSNDGVYKAVLNQHYNKRLSNDDFTKLIKLHIDHGLEVFNRDILNSNKGRNAHIDYLLSIINNGVSLISNPSIGFNTSSVTKTIGAYNGLLNVELGNDAKTGEKITIQINDENKFDSQHFAVAGMNGSGKTQLVQDILYQINKQSNNELKFIFFDYKGEGRSDKLKKFLTATQCEFVDIQEAPITFNPLTSISLTNERERTRLIKTFRDKLSAIDRRIGVKQKNNLEIAINRCFDRTIKEGRHPSIVEVYNELIEYYEESKLKQDSLTATIKDLSDVVFADDYDSSFKLTEKNLYVNLPTSLPDSARKASVFLILNYLLNFYIDSNDVKPSEDRIKPIRYIIVIDEAHAYLKEKNMAAVLEELLRMIRSKGVIIMMLSQGVEEYKQREFDFSSQVKIPILLNVQNKDIKPAKAFLGTPKNETSMKNALRNLDSGKGMVNFEDVRLMDVNMFWKREI